MHAKPVRPERRSLLGCLRRCFGSFEEQEVVRVEQTRDPKDISSIEREMRIKQWVVESNIAFHEQVAPDTNKGAVMKTDEDRLRLNVLDQHTAEQDADAFASKPKAGKVSRNHRKCRPREKAMKCEHDYPQHMPCDKRTCEAVHDPQQATSPCVGDSFRCLVPDAIDAISAYAPTSIRQKISEQTWFTAACTSSRK